MSLGDGGPSLSTFDSVTLLCPTHFHYSVHVLCCQTLRRQLTGVAFIIQCSTKGFITRSESIHQSWIKTLDFKKSKDCKDRNVFQVLLLFKLINNAKLACCHTFFAAHNMMERFYWVLSLCKCNLWMTRYFLVPLQMLFMDDIDKILPVFPSLWMGTLVFWFLRWWTENGGLAAHLWIKEKLLRTDGTGEIEDSTWGPRGPKKGNWRSPLTA